MESILTNSWTVGIIGGIISGLIVFFVTNRLVSRRENKEYQQKVRIANNELLYSIRPLIVEQSLPTIQMINSLLLSTAKKYTVQLADLYTKDDIADDLTKEVMDNPFLTSENKLRYCSLTEAIKILGLVSENDSMPTKTVTYSNDSKGISKEFFSLTLGFIASLTSIIIIVSKGNFLAELSSEKFSRFFVVATIITITIPVIALVFSKLLEIAKRRSMDRDIAVIKAMHRETVAKMEVAKSTNEAKDINN
jgi:hypothetical protein